MNSATGSTFACMEIIYYSDANFVKTPSQASETRLRADGLLKVTHTHTHTP